MIAPLRDTNQVNVDTMFRTGASQVEANATGSSASTTVASTSTADVASTSALAEAEDPAEDHVTDLDIKRAAAYRTTYAAGKQRIPPTWCGAHPKNREEMGPNSERCQFLLEKHLLGQFHPKEADHEAVCVQKNPQTEWFSEWLRKERGGDDTLAVVLNILFGSLGHTHVNQVLRNGDAGAKQDRKGLLKVCDQRGCLDVNLVMGVDKELAAYMKQGLEWEVLSWEMDVKEPDAATLIQVLAFTVLHFCIRVRGQRLSHHRSKLK